MVSCFVDVISWVQRWVSFIPKFPVSIALTSRSMRKITCGPISVGVAEGNIGGSIVLVGEACRNVPLSTGVGLEVNGVVAGAEVVVDEVVPGDQAEPLSGDEIGGVDVQHQPAAVVVREIVGEGVALEQDRVVREILRQQSNDGPAALAVGVVLFEDVAPDDDGLVTETGCAEPSAGVTSTSNRVIWKFPRGPRPGPRPGRRSSVSASMRRPVTFCRSVRPSSV